MLDSKRDLIGSTYNELMKWHRKQDPDNDKCYASDLDLCLISFDPPGIIAAIDYKRNGEGITRTEEVLYKTLHDMGIPVYIVSLHNSNYYVSQYLPETGDLVFRLFDADEVTYWQWEKELRRKWTSLQKSRNSMNSVPKGNWRGVASTSEQPQD